MVIKLKVNPLIISLILVLSVSTAFADTTKVRKETYPNGVRKADIIEHYNDKGRKFKEVADLYDNTGHWIQQKISFFDEDFITKTVRERREKDSRTKEDKLKDIFEFDYGNHKVKIERKITDEPTYGSGCSSHIPNYEIQQDANKDIKRKTDEEKFGKPKGGYWQDMFNFADDYACGTGVTVDKDNFDRRKTYRYRVNNSFDFKMQKWKPAAEYFLNKKKTKSIEFIFWDRKLTPEGGAGPAINYKMRF